MTVINKDCIFCKEVKLNGKPKFVCYNFHEQYFMAIGLIEEEDSCNGCTPQFEDEHGWTTTPLEIKCKSPKKCSNCNNCKQVNIDGAFINICHDDFYNELVLEYNANRGKWGCGRFEAKKPLRKLVERLRIETV